MKEHWQARGPLGKRPEQDLCKKKDFLAVGMSVWLVGLERGCSGPSLSFPIGETAYSTNPIQSYSNDNNSTLGTYRFFCGKRRMIADNIIDRNTNGKGHSSIYHLSIHFLGIKLGRRRLHDGMSKLTNIQDFGSRNALSDQSFQGQVDNFGSFLIFGTDIAKKYKRRKEGSK